MSLITNPHSPRMVSRRRNPLATTKVGDMTFVIGVKSGSTINVAIQFLQNNGDPITSPGILYGYLSNDAAGLVIATAAPTGGFAIGTNGLCVQPTTKSMWLTSNASGQVDITLTDSGTPLFYLQLRDDNGYLYSVPIQF